jgi:stage II sporulation protein D
VLRPRTVAADPDPDPGARKDRMPIATRARHRRALLLLPLLAAGLALPAPVVAGTRTPAGTPTAAGTPTPLPEAVQFFGRGYGHGVGLSQYGARGRAAAGQYAGTILFHYYQGTVLDVIDPATTIRVLLMSGFVATDAAPLTIVAHDAPWTAKGIAGLIPAGAQLTVRPPAAGTTRWRLTVHSAAGTVLGGGGSSGPITVTPASAAGHLELKSKPSSYDEYRGSLVVRPNGTTSLNVVNHVGLDAYLRGVVPTEMPASWPVQALKAQAIAARSYAAYRIRTTNTFDVYDDTRSQVYRGILIEQPPTDDAIEVTAGRVLRSNGGLVNALFHSTGGCATEHNENAFVASSGAKVAGPLGYLRGSPDRRGDGSCWDAASPYVAWQTGTYTIDALSAMFSADERTAVGTLTALDLSNRGVSGRLVSVTLVGSVGTKTVSGDVFRAVFNAKRPAGDPSLRSNAFDLAPLP